VNPDGCDAGAGRKATGELKSCFVVASSTLFRNGAGGGIDDPDEARAVLVSTADAASA
jgi:hypothetical protein